MKHSTIMMKRSALALCLLTLCFALAGCGSSAAAQSAASTSAQAASTAAAESATQAAAADDGTLVYKSVNIRPGASAAPVLEALGEPDEYSENISCMFESGMDKTYTYADVVLYTYPTADDERILLAEAVGEGTETARGIKVGDALDAALLQYAEDLTADSTDHYSCTFGDVAFALQATDGVVSDITVELAETPNA